MDPDLAIAIAVFVSILLVVQWQRRRALQRLEYIRTCELPRGLFERLRKRRPTLGLKDCQLVGHAMRQFFLAHAMSGRKYVSMPSQVVDDLWHEFILYTKHYDAFCRQAFGKFLHHTPAAAVGSNRTADEGLRRVWHFVCREENINPRNPSRLPLLFAIDAKLGIEDGFTYVADCKSKQQAAAGANSRVIHCGSDLGGSSFDGTGDGGAGHGADCGDGGGGSDSGGCGGGGCGGGGGD